MSSYLPALQPLGDERTSSTTLTHDHDRCNPTRGFPRPCGPGAEPALAGPVDLVNPPTSERYF